MAGRIHDYRRGWSKLIFLCWVVLPVLFLSAGYPGSDRTAIKDSDTLVHVALFDIDATPPAGSMLAYDTMTGVWDLGLRARGIVITGAGKPVVLCAVDWIGIGNESQDSFKVVLARAASTVPERVSVHTLHQHDAPICDFTAERILNEAGMPAGSFDGTFAREFLHKLANAVEKSMQNLQPVTHIGTGEAPVRQVASNRRIPAFNGTMAMRGSSCRDSALRAQPEGVIDSMVTVISLWNEEQPLVVLSFYAVHPQSYYLTKVANPDFPGLARFYRQLEVPGALHVHFNGAGGNVAAGKYNDGAKENRDILARRLSAGMKQACISTVRKPLKPAEITWDYREVVLPAQTDSVIRIRERMKKGNKYFITNNMGKLAWYERQTEGRKDVVSCLGIGDARILFLPGELFVEYQLAAKALRGDLKVAMAAYGDYGPFYIGTEKAYSEGGYEISASPVTSGAEPVLMKAIGQLLGRE